MPGLLTQARIFLNQTFGIGQPVNDEEERKYDEEPEKQDTVDFNDWDLDNGIPEEDRWIQQVMEIAADGDRTKNEVRNITQTLPEWAYEDVSKNTPDVKIIEWDGPDYMSNDFKDILRGDYIRQEYFPKERVNMLERDVVQNPEYNRAQKQTLIDASRFVPEWGLKMLENPELDFQKMIALESVMENGASQDWIEKSGLADPALSMEQFRDILLSSAEELEHMEAIAPGLKQDMKDVIESLDFYNETVKQMQKADVDIDSLNVSQIMDAGHDMAYVQEYQSFMRENHTEGWLSYEAIKKHEFDILSNPDYNMAQKEVLCAAQERGVTEAGMEYLKNPELDATRMLIAENAMRAGATPEMIASLTDTSLNNKQFEKRLNEVSEELDSPDFSAKQQMRIIENDERIRKDLIWICEEPDLLTQSQLNNLNNIMTRDERYVNSELSVLANPKYTVEQQNALADVMCVNHDFPDEPYPPYFMRIVEQPGLSRTQIEAVQELYDMDAVIKEMESVAEPGMDDKTVRTRFNEISAEITEYQELLTSVYGDNYTPDVVENRTGNIEQTTERQEITTEDMER